MTPLLQWDPEVPGLCRAWTSHMLQAYIDDPWTFSLTYVHGRRAPANPYMLAGKLWGETRQALDLLAITGEGSQEAILASYVRELHRHRFIDAGNQRMHPERLLAALIAVMEEEDPYTPLREGVERKWYMQLGGLGHLRGSFDGLALRADGRVCVREYKLTTSGFFFDRYAQSLQVLFYALGARHLFNEPPIVLIDVTSVTSQPLRVLDGVFKSGARAGQPKLRKLGDVPFVQRRVWSVEFTQDQLDEARSMICYWCSKAEVDALRKRFSSPLGYHCPWNPNGQSRYDSETNQSVMRLIHAQPPAERAAAIDMYLTEPDDGYCRPWPDNSGLTGYR